MTCMNTPHQTPTHLKDGRNITQPLRARRSWNKGKKKQPKQSALYKHCIVFFLLSLLFATAVLYLLVFEFSIAKQTVLRSSVPYSVVAAHLTVSNARGESRALEGCRVGSKSPSRVWDGDKKIAGNFAWEKENCLPSRQINDFQSIWPP